MYVQIASRLNFLRSSQKRPKRKGKKRETKMNNLFMPMTSSAQTHAAGPEVCLQGRP
jgi:hypothetical protein